MQDIEVELANLWLRYERYLPRPEKKFLWRIFPQKSLSYEIILSRMKKNSLISLVFWGRYNVYLYLLVEFICHFLMKALSDSIINFNQYWPYTLMLVVLLFYHSHGLEIKMANQREFWFRLLQRIALLETRLRYLYFGI